MYASPHRPRPSFLSLPTDIYLRIFTHFQRLTPPSLPLLYPAQIHPSLLPLSRTLYFRHTVLTSLARFDSFQTLIEEDSHAWEREKRRTEEVVRIIEMLGGLRELRVVNVKTLGEELSRMDEVLPWMTEMTRACCHHLPTACQRAHTPSHSPSLPMTDYLTKLPTELFLDICQRVQDAKQGPYLGAISKAFLPFAREATFGKTTITTYLDLTYKDVKDVGLPTKKDLGKLFGRVPRTTTLSIVGSTRIAKMVLSPPALGAFFPSLNSLAIEDPFDEWSNPFAPTHFAALRNYPLLHYLGLDVSRRRESLGRHRGGDLPPWRPCRWWLCLRGPLLDNPAAHDLIRWMDRLEGLSLFDVSWTRPIESLKDLLDSVSQPIGVQQLSLARIGAVVANGRLQYLEDDVSSVLPSFTGLTARLEFFTGAFHRDCLPVICGMQHLQKLIFHPSTCDSTHDLKGLVSGLAKSSNLRKIVLNQVVDASLLPLWDVWREKGISRYHGWTDDFTLEGLADLLEIADEKGVKFEGLAVDLVREELARRRKAADTSKASRQGGALLTPLAFSSLELADLVSPHDHSLPMTDYLTKLPTELFLDICQRVQDAKQGPYLGAISKAFLPFAREATFGETTVRTYARLQKLCDMVGTGRETLASIGDLRLALLQAEDHNLPNAKDLTNLFRALVNTIELEVEGSNRIAKMVLAPVKSRRSWPTLPRLESLTIEDPLEGWANPFAPAHYVDLVYYPEMHSLDLLIERSRASLGRYQPCDLPAFPPFGWFLAFRGPILDNPAMPDLLDWFESPRGLYLHDTPVEEAATSGSLASLLSKVPDPDSVTCLSLCRMEGAENLNTALQALPNVSTALEFGAGTWHPDCLAAVRGMKHLEELCFDRWTTVTVCDLASLIVGPDKHPSLKVVSLHNIWDNEMESDWVDDESDDQSDRYEGWTDDFTLEGLADLLEIADKEGVQLEGLAVDLAREEFARRLKAAATSKASNVVEIPSSLCYLSARARVGRERHFTLLSSSCSLARCSRSRYQLRGLVLTAITYAHPPNTFTRLRTRPGALLTSFASSSLAPVDLASSHDYSLAMTDYLTKLPVELFLDICQRVQDAKQGPYLGAVSKAFVSFAREATFGDTTVKTYERLQKLCNLATLSPSAIASVRSLYLPLKNAHDDGIPRAFDLAVLLARLTGLNVLDIERAPRVAKTVLAPTSARRPLPRLTGLRIDDPLEGWANPFAISHYVNLYQYPNLFNLTLHVEREVDSLGPYHATDEPEWAPFCWSVTLRGPILDNPAARDFVHWLRSSDAPYLHDYSKTRTDDSFASFLEVVRDPQDLRGLSLLRLAEAKEDLHLALERFENLFGLELRAGTTLKPCLSTLRSLASLERLFFYVGAKVTTKDLKSLVTGRGKLPLLNLVGLHVLFDNCVFLAQDYGGIPEDYAYDYYEYSDNPRYYGWTSDFTLDGLVDLLEIADEEGIKFEGLAVKLAREELAYRKIEEARKKRHAAAKEAAMMAQLEAV
uniref:BY PROTMAP: gi/342318918/gb/EGU10874.1/ Cell wall surface anchored protein [Rhodotorula glutinis ATCC 204091] n=1 Tax=Rhodotorula toruloides TaxID=5286 RepID=A0A0K3CQ09_RHOTO